MTPLAPLRTIPMSKRPLASTPEPRKKQKTSTNHHFKIPALPRRALTPSTSTVAASSSPPRLSSPAREDMEVVVVRPGVGLVFGRHRHRMEETTTGKVELRTAIPGHLHHLVRDIEAPGTIVYLSRYASHASRTHALVEYDGEGDELRILAIGQNGMKVGGRRVLAGQRVEVGRKDRVTLDFYGTRVGLMFQSKEVEDLFTPEMSRVSLPPSSPPVESEPLEPLSPVSASPLSPVSPVSRGASPLFSRDSSPLSTPSDGEGEAEMEAEIDAEVEMEDEEVDQEEQADQEEQDEPLEAILPLAVPSPVRAKSVKQEMIESAELAPVPSDVDLPALLASTVVFSGSSKLSLPDLVKHMLDSQPSLRDVGEESSWLGWAGRELETNPMFGKVQRHGKDASGHPLLPHYFYNPANDPDASRAAELGGLVRPLRTVQRAGGKAIDWRPVGSGRRR